MSVASSRNATTGVSRPFTMLLAQRLELGRRRQRVDRRAAQHGRARRPRRGPAAAARGSRCRRRACTRRARRSRAARPRPRRSTGRCRARTRAAPRRATCSLTTCWRSCIARRGRERAVGVIGLRERRAEHGHHRVADVLHHRAALGEDRGVHLGAVRVEHRRRARSGRRARRCRSSRGRRTSAR